jgi:hypothetical protein
MKVGSVPDMRNVPARACINRYKGEFNSLPASITALARPLTIAPVPRERRDAPRPQLRLLNAG